MTGSELFESSLDWLREHYHEKRFFLERDVVWTIKTQLIKTIEERLEIGVQSGPTSGE